MIQFWTTSIIGVCLIKVQRSAIRILCRGNVYPGHEWGLLHVLQMSQPQTFQELATKVHDMEVTIVDRRGNSFDFAESKKDKAKFKRNVKFSKNSTKEVMPISKPKSVWITGKPKLEDKKSTLLRMQ